MFWTGSSWCRLVTGEFLLTAVDREGIITLGYELSTVTEDIHTD